MANKLNKALRGLIATLALVIVGVGFFFAGRATAPDSAAAVSAGASSEYDFSNLNDIVRLLQNDYVKPDNIDPQTLYEAAINGITGVLNDSGTYYIDPNTYRLDTVLTGGFDGIGATVAQQNNEIVIVAPIKGTPAEQAGIQPGDTILEVDGESTKGWTVEKTVLRIRGERGTKVTITIRNTNNDVKQYTLTRDRIKVDSVLAIAPNTTLQDAAGSAVKDIGYLQVREFSPSTAQELDTATKDLMSKGAKALIIDVRRNGGGVLNTTIQSADLFLDSGTILIQRDADGKETTYSARRGDVANGLPIVVLQDRFSASASEVLGSALRDNARAMIIGEKSFGKGTVNSPRQLKDGGALMVTIAQWLTPKGALIDKIGVFPDIEVVPTDEDRDLRRDVQLHRAIETLRAQMSVR